MPLTIDTSAPPVVVVEATDSFTVDQRDAAVREMVSVLTEARERAVLVDITQIDMDCSNERAFAFAQSLTVFTELMPTYGFFVATSPFLRPIVDVVASSSQALFSVKVEVCESRAEALTKIQAQIAR